ncbi:MAG: carbohydrate binding family 9 domain-containing protein [Sphingobacteriales bacterium]|nr:carbohydrate binding family 9 domain-containing protein [Sphingobacteriales bacterium]
MRYFLLNFLLAAITIQVDAQEKIKTLPAKKTAQAPKIDGIIDDSVWKNAPLATNFVAFQPEPGLKEDKAHQTQVYVLYDDQAIYFAARMKESKPENISSELVDRDNVGNADFFDVVIDTYNDKINASEFVVTSAGIQLDAKFSAQGEDGNWNAVWESAVQINGNEWTAEMRIPYSALRFANKDVQNWGLNFVRNRQKFQQKLTWNELDPKKNGFINQEGELVGIEKIKAPLRLSFSPYLSTYVNHYPYNQAGIKNTSNSVNGGMDVKFGINESFTLDMTLVPDFGQVQSDNQVLNLTPFEIRYSENRPFFTEGTELFSKGDLFYSRRVGATPVNQYKVNNALVDGDKIISNPSQTKLLNATKLSGRTSKGLGIGIFNGLTEKTDAVIEHANGIKQTIETAPLTNYNILVFDQNLKNNSSVSFINSNVTRSGSTYDANVTAVVFDLNTKENKYNLNGSAKMSQLYGGNFAKPSVGYSYQINPGKRSGNFNYNYALTVVDDQFNPNDLGILFNNNYINHSVYLGYNWYKASKWYSQLQIWGGAKYVSRFRPNTYQSENAFIGGWARFKNLWTGNINIQADAEGNDFYEPRTEGHFFKRSATQSYSLHFNSNESKKISGGAFFSIRHNQLFNGRGFAYGTYQNFRLNKKLRIGTDVSINPQQNYAGYISNDSLGNIIFSRRNVRTVENSLNVKYTMSNKMGFNLRVRHYWSKLMNKAFYTLEQDGRLAQNLEFSKNKNLDQNFNAFNVDMIYIWRFSPGSELSLAWKNSALTFDNHSQNQYFRNLDFTLHSPQNNNFSIKILYYLDYLQLRRKVS